jgi:hypothetical protein
MSTMNSAPVVPHSTSRERFKCEARLLLALSLHETGRITTSTAARLVGMARVVIMTTPGLYGLSPIGVDLEALEQDAANA